MVARFEQAELLKKQYTDKFVVVKSDVPELRRFQGMTGVVKTVNMSCRALVLFDGSEDIGWYDIDPTFLTVVDAPAPKKPEPKAAAKEAPTAKAAPATKPDVAVAKPAGEKKLSPLEMIRQQAAGGSKSATAPTASAVAKEAAAPATGGAKLSPLEMIRKQGGAKPAAPASAPASVEATAAPVANVEAPSTPAPVVEAKPAAPAAADGKKLSPLEQIRMQGAAKRG